MTIGSSIREAVRLGHRANSTFQAYRRSPAGSVRGLIREAIGIEDPRIEWGKILVASDYLTARLDGRKPQVIVTLGSGLGPLADAIKDQIVISYEDIPCFPQTDEHVSGHAGELVVGTLGGKMVAAMSGRFHLYQGVTPREAVRPLRTLLFLGSGVCRTFIVTNAAGYLNPKFETGDFMLIKDDLNLTFANPLVGPNLQQFGPRFPDMSAAYSLALQELALRVADKQGIRDRIREGIYCANLGPNYERPFENRVLASWGIDAVGMSTAPEVLAANHAKKLGILRILGISLITNPGAGVVPFTTLDHDEVKREAKKAEARFVQFVTGIIEEVN